MTPEINANGALIPTVVRGACKRIVIITARWNSVVTEALEKGAKDGLLQGGVEDRQIEIVRVPGTVELVHAAAVAMKVKKPDAVIILGCVVRGDTPHFDYVCQSVTQGMTELNVRGECPVVFGVLTTENMEQALERAGGRLGNKGTECAAVAIEMINMNYWIRH